jgi:hypothetical protein
MGGGDLNLKKSWHPGTLKNQTIVWEREQKLLEEERKLKELRKELENEREREKLYELQGKKKVRLEWMYSASYNNEKELSKDKEDYLLGKKRVDLDTLTSKEDQQANFHFATNSIYGVSANSANDFKSKIRDDPLLAFRKKEQEAMDLLAKRQMLAQESTKQKGSKTKKSKKSKRNEKHRSRSPESDRRARRSYDDSDHRDGYRTERKREHAKDSNSRYHRSHSRSRSPSHRSRGHSSMDRHGNRHYYE